MPKEIYTPILKGSAAGPITGFGELQVSSLLGLRAGGTKNIAEPAIVSDREVTLHGKDPISLTNLLRGVLRRADVKEWPKGYLGEISAIELYHDLADRPAYGFAVIDRNSGDRQYCVVGPELNGLEVHASLFYPAPDKDTFGFDHRDVLGDERKLFNPANKALLNSHRTMEGWEGVFEPGRALMYQTMRAYYESDDPTITLRPFLRWQTTETGEHIIAPNPFSDSIRDAVGQAVPDIDPTRLDGIMGMVFLAAFSPYQTEWDQWNPYGRVPSDTRQRTEATQMGPFVLRKVIEKQKYPGVVDDNQDIQQSPILDAWENYLAAA
ncbi:MAG TPA: hypothetical protein VLF93_04450 [Candidatus Saccharimonadales bacterium]|nr:hypothetical protein [Candidatus Saccharimonadales bacterium]